MYPNAYLDYLIHFHVDRDYFECHEVLEDYWKEQPKGFRQGKWVALIQLAVGLYHHRRGNKKGARVMYNRATKAILKEKSAISKLDLHVPTILKQIDDQLTSLEETKAFSNINLPFTHDRLLLACEHRCKELNIDWVMNESPVPTDILHKHTTRNLEAVIAERERQLLLRAERRKLVKNTTWM